MMRKFHPNSALVLKQTLLLLGIFTIIRILFRLIHTLYFEQVDWVEMLHMLLWALRFDLSVIFILNGIYFLAILLPLKWTTSKSFLRYSQFLFLLINSIAFLFDLADIGYYPYVRKRMTAQVFDLIGNQSDFIDLLPSYLNKFWYVSLSILIFLGLFMLINRVFLRQQKEITAPFSMIWTSIQWLIFMGLSIFFIRGGLQLKPIQTSTALLYVNNEKIPLVVSASFSVLHSFEQKGLKPLNTFSDQTLTQYFNPIKQYHRGGKLQTNNVVVLVLESFGKMYTGLGGRKSYTPFLDSLSNHTLVFDQAFANAFTSGGGLPAILTGIPHIMQESLAFSPYATNQMESLPALLKPYGYHSVFFHGGSNGTMNFDALAKNMGFDAYYGRTEYGNDRDYDGTWGIWDIPYLQYCQKELSQMKQPFLASIFTLSSHEPFALPEDIQDPTIRSLKGIQRGIRYTDLALKQFFAEASKTSWFKNTLFVISADHSYLAGIDPLGYYNTNMGLYAIPVMFFHPGIPALKGRNHQVMQQIDVLPTILDLLHYPDAFYALGSSALDSNRKGFLFNQMDNYIQFLYGNRLLTFQDTLLTAAYEWPADSLLRYPISLKDSLIPESLKFYQAFRQTLVNDLIHDRHSLKSR
jgi:phosphoglycerol transferase MdoB-like AlkP superfamily enzyme